MSTFPTPTRATTINNLNLVSQNELEATTTAKTVIALADGTPRSFDLKAMQASIERNGERIVENEGRIEQNSAQIEQNHTLQSNEMTSLWMRLAQLENRTLEEWMPVGHIIVQLPSQPEPSVLYPNATWENISASYAGAFFRAEGGLASPFGSGSQTESAPNIEGTIYSVDWSYVGSQAEGSQIDLGSFDFLKKSIHTVYPGVDRWGIFKFDASRSSPAYGRRAEVAPKNQTIRIWRKIGTISGTRSYALIDDDGIYQHNVELAEDEAGIIGYNPHIHIDSPPVKSLISRHAKSSHEVLVYHRERATWESVVDNRGRTAYLRDGSGSRIIHQLGDTLAEGETWDAPEPAEA